MFPHLDSTGPESVETWFLPFQMALVRLVTATVIAEYFRSKTEVARQWSARSKTCSP